MASPREVAGEFGERKIRVFVVKWSQEGSVAMKSESIGVRVAWWLSEHRQKFHETTDSMYSLSSSP